MKTLWKNQIVEITPQLDFEEDCSGIGIITDGNVALPEKLGEERVEGWNFYQYEHEPLYFISTPMLTAVQKIAIIEAFDRWYADTDQETPDWALEFQLITRMILENYLILNPQMLELTDECLLSLKDIIWNTTSDERAVWVLKRANNVDTDIKVTAFSTSNAAQTAMAKDYAETMQLRCQKLTNECFVEDMGAAVYDGSDLYYWQIEKLSIPLESDSTGLTTNKDTFEKTDERQYVAKISDGQYYLVEARYAEDKYLLVNDSIHLSDWLDENGNYNIACIDIIKAYYGSVKEFLDANLDTESREQVLAEMIFEETSYYELNYELIPENKIDTAIEKKLEECKKIVNQYKKNLDEQVRMDTASTKECPWYTECWYREDLINALESCGIIPTEENVNKLLSACQDLFNDKSDRNEMLSIKANELFATH